MNACVSARNYYWFSLIFSFFRSTRGLRISVTNANKYCNTLDPLIILKKRETNEEKRHRY